MIRDAPRCAGRAAWVFEKLYFDTGIYDLETFEF